MLQNRVDPKGEIIKTEARGTMMGNRGVIHDVHQEIVRAYKHKAWITCALQFKGRHRTVMSLNRWTELFFLDEATAFAAGHRPCSECRHEKFKHFKLCWINGNPQYGFTMKVSIKEIDNIIHEERIDSKDEKVTHEANIHDLPNGTFIVWNADAFLLADDLAYRWSPFGYAQGIAMPQVERVMVLTPRSIVSTFKAGYNVGIHFPTS